MGIVSENERESDKYDSVCKNLDKLIIESFDLQKEMLEKRKAMELVIKSAFFNMAQAKYLLGCTRMSMLQVNTSDMEAVLKSQMEEQDSQHNTSQYSYNSFKLIKSDTKDASIITNTEINSDGIRKRKETDKPVKDDIGNDTKAVKEKSRNPLLWFGVLVPECLRDCQKLFQQTTELSLEIATLQSKISKINTLYKSERSIKNSLIKKANEN